MRHNERADGMGQLRDVTADLVRTVSSGETGGALASVETAQTRAALRKALAAGRERPREPPARLVRSIGIALPGGGAPALLETWVLAGGSSDQPGQCDVPLAVLRPSASASGAGSGRRNGQAARPCVLLLHTTNQPKEMFLDPRQCAVTMGHYVDAGFVAAAIDLRYLGARGGQMQYTRAMKVRIGLDMEARESDCCSLSASPTDVSSPCVTRNTGGLAAQPAAGRGVGWRWRGRPRHCRRHRHCHSDASTWPYHRRWHGQRPGEGPRERRVLLDGLCLGREQSDRLLARWRRHAGRG